MPPSRPSSAGKTARIAASPYQPGDPGRSIGAASPVGGALGPPPGLGEPLEPPQTRQLPVRGASAPPDGRAHGQPTMTELDLTRHSSPHHVVTGRGDIHGNEFSAKGGSRTYA